jgi:hypothetical protein
MRYQQKQRNVNKTERQRYESNGKSCVEQSNACLLDMINNFKIAHKEFSGGSGGTIDRDLDWDAFLSNQNESFRKIMSRKRARGVPLNYQVQIIRKWNHIINTFKNASRMGTQNAADNRYKEAIAVMNRVF